MTFTKAELNQLLYCLEVRERDGWYYANREQFEKRHKSIMKKLTKLLEETNK